MSYVNRYRHVVRVLTAFTLTLLALAVSAPAAFGMRTGAEDSGGTPPPLRTGKDPTYTLTHTVATGGVPGWELAVIVTAAVLLTATVALIVRRVRVPHRDQVVPAT
jgi:hypothetical protein